MSKKSNSNTRGTVKGMPSAVVLAIAIHVGLFFLAGALVVFKYVIKPEPDFGIVEQVVRPPRALKKPKVQVKKSSRPKATARITSQINPQAMPSIDLPAVSGFGEGLGDGLGGDGFDFDINFEPPTIVGTLMTDGSDLEGTFYDFNRNRAGNETGMDQFAMKSLLQDFHRRGWNENVFNRVYRSPKKLYAQAIGVGPMPSPLVPQAFGEPDNKDQTWIVLYKGKLVHKDGISFRFVGNSDDKMAVWVDGKAVLDACRYDNQNTGPGIAFDWEPTSADHRKWFMCHDYCAVGDLITLEPGVPKDIKIIIGEGPGSLFNAILWVKVEGEEYETKSGGIPILPLYMTGRLPRRIQDLIYRGIPQDEVCVTSGPIFNDFISTIAEEPAPTVAKSDAATETNPSDTATQEVAEVEQAPVPGPGVIRTWTLTDGTTFEAKLLTNMRRYILVEPPGGGQEKVPMENLSDEDRLFVTLAYPPTIDIEWTKNSSQRRLKWDVNQKIMINGWHFGPKVRCADRNYPLKLKVDYWAIGKELAGSPFILLDKGSRTFIPAETPDGRIEFTGPTVDLYNWSLNEGKYYGGQTRGEGVKGYLVTVTDERGVVIATAGSPKWLYTHLDKLKDLEVWSFMDDECNRVWPTPPQGTVGM